MKLNVLILLFAVAVTALFSGCRNCYSCLADGENFNLTVASGQTVTYINDAQIQKTLSVRTSGSWPDDEYCGRVGSGSYGKCGAKANAFLENIQDSLAICYECSTGYNDDVEQNVYRLVGIGRQANIDIWLMSINSGVGSAIGNNGTVNLVENITIGGKHYSNAYEYQNSSAGIHECTDFVYSVEYGVLKFTMRLENSVENWALVK